MYAVTATVSVKGGAWSSVSQVPTFFLDENVRGSRTRLPPGGSLDGFSTR
jgi:hypothetical protein